jgi:hypothetical protein
MDIGDVLSRAWRTVWKHKILWIFGLMAGLISAASSGGSNSGYRFSSSDFDGFNINLSNGEWWAIGAGLLCLGVIFFFLVIFLGAIGRIGLVRGTQLVNKGQERLTFGELFNQSMPYFWRVFGLTLIIPVLVFFGVLLIGIPLSIITCGIGAIAMIIALMLLPVLVELSVIAIVVEDVGIFDGLKRGWDVFRRNPGEMILMWLILVVGLGLILVFIVGIPIALFLTPVAVVTSVGSNQSPALGTIISIICLVAFLPVLLIVAGIVRSFITSAWTLTYLELTGRSSKLVPTLPIEEPEEPQLPEEAEEPEEPEKPEAPQPPEPEEPLPPPL